MLIPKMKVDTREKIPERELMRRICGKDIAGRYNTDFEYLERGDYQCGICLFERKDIADLVNSMYSMRLFKQLNELSIYCEKNDYIGFLMVHGGMKELIEMVNHGVSVNLQAINGAIASCIVRYGVQLIWIDAKEACFETIWYISKKVAEGKLGLPHRQLLRNHPSKKVAILANTLHVSHRLAESLLRKFKTYRGVMLATDKEISVVDGVGPSTLARLKYLLGE